MTTRTSVAVPSTVRRALLGLALLAGLVAVVVVGVDAVVRGHRSGTSTLLAVVAAVVAVVAVAVAVLPPAAAPDPWALRRTAEIVTVLGVVAVLLLLLTVSYLPRLRSLGYDAVDAETALTLSRPPGTEAGDLLVAQVHERGPGPLKGPAGWTRLATTPLTATPLTADGAETVELWTHVAADDDPTGFAFATDAPGGKIGGITSWSHAGTAAVRAESKGDAGPVGAPAVTLTTSQSPLLFFVATDGLTRTAAPDGLTEGFSASADGVFKATTALEMRDAGAGEEVDPTTLAPAAGGPWVVQAVELAPQ